MSTSEDKMDKLSTELSRLSSLLVQHITENRVTLDQLKDKLNDHGRELWGYNGNAGLSKNVDRLVQIETGRKWTIRAIAGATVAGITDRIFHVLSK